MPRYNPKGRSRWYFVASLATPGNPSAAAVIAGDPLHTTLKALSGFTSEVEDLDNSDMSSTWGKTPAASSMTFYAGDAPADVEEVTRAALGQGLAGFIVLSRYGAPVASTGKGDVYPVRIKASNQDALAENAVQTFTVGFSIYDPPSKNVSFAA
jgi:hypothetical protein